MSSRLAVDAVLQVIEGLEAANRKGVLHRDIKPAELFRRRIGIDQDRRLRVVHLDRAARYT